jgi:hypothetical protein
VSASARSPNQQASLVAGRRPSLPAEASTKAGATVSSEGGNCSRKAREGAKGGTGLELSFLRELL